MIQHNHFDPIWRRCWDRTFDYKGQRFRSYADLEEYFIDIWLENAKSGLAFSEGQAVVFRKYLDRNPERLAEMRELVDKGLIELTAGGETVADTNMPSGESLLRNLVMGQLWFDDVFGVTPNGGWLEDAFGQSAQIPQIFRGCECNILHKLSYKRVPGKYWKGLDGTVIYTGQEPGSSGAGHCTKISPCAECKGVGCEACHGRGLSDQGDISIDDIRWALDKDFTEHPFYLISIGGEEAVPNPQLPDLVKEAEAKLGITIQPGGYNTISDFYASEIAASDDPDLEVSGQVEANPVSTGCYVSRIKIKQVFRRVENMLNTAERWAAVGWLLGNEYPEDCLRDAWQDLLYIAFHDAITSTHIDQAYIELLDMLASAEHEAAHVMDDALLFISQSIFTDTPDEDLAIFNSDSWERRDPVCVVFNGMQGFPRITGPDGAECVILDAKQDGENLHVTFRPPSVPALGYSVVHVEPSDDPLDEGSTQTAPGSVANEFYEITCSAKGITSIVDRRRDQEVLDIGRYLGGELILEEDIGHPWGTMKPPSSEERLGQYTTDVTIRQSQNRKEIIITGQYRGSDANIKILSWRQSVKLYSGVNRIDFHTEIDWDTSQRRIRVAFPTSIKTDEAIYSVPYGAVKRGQYEPDVTQMCATNGDWPAINWVDVADSDSKHGVALINTGTPSHIVKDGVILLSILRSPTDSWCLNEPEHYDCPDFDGARDAGRHEFDVSLIPHVGDFAAAEIEKRAREVNNPLQITLLGDSVDEGFGKTHSFMTWKATDNIVLSALKKAETEDALIARICETSGMDGQISVRFEGTQEQASKVNFLERLAEPAPSLIPISPWKIQTLRFDASEI